MSVNRYSIFTHYTFKWTTSRLQKSLVGDSPIYFYVLFFLFFLTGETRTLMKNNSMVVMKVHEMLNSNTSESKCQMKTLKPEWELKILHLSAF